MASSRAILLALAVFLAVRTAGAQVGAECRTLEARIVEAELVARGTIVKAERAVVVPVADSSRDGSPRPNGQDKIVLTVSIDEILKGDGPEAIELEVERLGFDKRVEQWMERKTEFLWFVEAKAADEASPRWHHIRLSDAVPAEAKYKSEAPPVFSMDYTVLRTADDMLSAARQFVKVAGQVKRTRMLTIPRVVADQCRPSGDFNFLVVPVHSSLEKTAHRLLRSPEEFVPANYKLDSLSRYQLRQGGAETLQHFRSDENIELLKSLLDDRAWIYRHGPRPGERVKRFPIRATAYETLTRWSVDVPRPIVEETVSDDDQSPDSEALGSRLKTGGLRSRHAVPVKDCRCHDLATESPCE